jgi:hypothetical protein
MRRLRPLALPTLAITAAIALSGCMANPLDRLIEDAVQGGVENIIENELGENVDVTLPGQPGGQLPSTWPSDVPTPAGDVVFAVASPGNWTASIIVDGQGAVDSAYAELERAGFTLDSEANFGGFVTRTYINDVYQVSVSALPDEADGFTLQYVILEEGAQ